MPTSTKSIITERTLLTKKKDGRKNGAFRYKGYRTYIEVFIFISISGKNALSIVGQALKQIAIINLPQKIIFLSNIYNDNGQWSPSYFLKQYLSSE